MKNKLANNDDVPIWVVLFSSEALAKVHPSWVKIADNPHNLPEQQLEKWCYWPKGVHKGGLQDDVEALPRASRAF